MYKYINEHLIQHITEQDKIIFSTEDNSLVTTYLNNEELKELGWKELFQTDYPREKEFYHVETRYEDGEVITQHHELVKDNEPNYDDLVHQFIRGKYTYNDEFEALRLGNLSAEWIEYNNYVNEVRKLAKEHIERWQQA